jgi:hypothetical protein
VSHAVPLDQYAKAAQEALSKLSPEDREEFLKVLQKRAAERGVELPGKVASDPKDLGKVLTDLHKKPGAAPGYPRPRRRPSASVRIESPHRHAVARGHRGYSRQAHDGFVPNDVKLGRSI